LGFIGGTYYNFTDYSILSTELLIGGVFSELYNGNEAVLQDIFEEQPHREGGNFMLSLTTDYSYTFDFDPLSFGMKPNLKLGLVSVSYKNSLEGAPQLPPDNYFTLSLGLDIGLRFRPSEKSAFFTGVGLRFFEWNTHSKPGGEDKYKTKESEWEFNGIEWNEASLANGNLGFGMTINPTDYFKIGLGLNSFLNNIVELNLRDMTIKAGPIWGENKGNFGSWLSGLFKNVIFDLTISLKIPSGGVNGDAE
jgi:hypothetical protein